MLRVADVNSGERVIVIDNGSGICKAGFAGDPSPRFSFASLAGTLRKTYRASDPTVKESFVGDAGQGRSGLFALKYPIADGNVKNWDDMKKYSVRLSISLCNSTVCTCV